MELSPEPEGAAERHHAADVVSGVLSSAAIFVSLIGLTHKPVRIVPFAIVVALVAAAMSDRHPRLAQAAVAISGACFLIGMIVAVVTNNPLY